MSKIQNSDKRIKILPLTKVKIEEKLFQFVFKFFLA